jgi:hypothetical protein
MPALWRPLAALLVVTAGVFSVAGPASFATASAHPAIRVVPMNCPASTNWDVVTKTCV